RLVEQDDRGIRCESTGKRDALPLSARQLVGVAVAESLEAHQLEQILHALHALRPLHAVQPVGDVARYREVREERVVLEDETDAALLGRHHVARARYDAVADGDRAGRGRLESCDRAEECGLAGAALADDPDQLTGLDLEVDGAECCARSAGIRLPDVAQDQPAHRVERPPSSRSSPITGRTPAPIRMSAAHADSAICSSDASWNAFVASVSKLNGRRISVAGSSLSTSTNTRIAAPSSAARSSGRPTRRSVPVVPTPSVRDAASRSRHSRSKPASIGRYATAMKRTAYA